MTSRNRTTREQFPPLRDNSAGAIHASDLISGMAEGLCTHERLDPFWDQIWARRDSSVTWRSYATAEAHVVAGLGGLPSAYRLTEVEAWQKLESRYSRKGFLRLLAVLLMWRTVTAEQAEALCGARGASNPLAGVVAAAFRVGILELGSASSGLLREPTSRRGTLYRLSESSAYKRVVERLTFAEWMSLTGSQKWERGGQYDRHNVLATELGVRLAEYADVATVLGEKFASINLLAGSGIGWPGLETDSRSADMVVVRPDGFKIAIEVTATTSPHFAAKVERWARLLNERPLNTSGLSVLFVVTAQPGESAVSVRRETFKAVAAAARRFPGTAYERIADRIGVATWTEWFPSRHTFSPNFFGMTVHMPAGMKEGVMTWREVDMLSTTAYPFAPSAPGLTTILDNCHLMWGAPVTLRDHTRAPSLIPLMLHKAGVSGHGIPYSQAKRSRNSKGHTPGEAKGVAGPTKMPARCLPYM